MNKACFQSYIFYWIETKSVQKKVKRQILEHTGSFNTIILILICQVLNFFILLYYFTKRSSYIICPVAGQYFEKFKDAVKSVMYLNKRFVYILNCYILILFVKYDILTEYHLSINSTFQFKKV